MIWKNCRCLWLFVFLIASVSKARTLSLKEFASEYKNKSYRIQASQDELSRDEHRLSEAKMLALPSVELGINQVKQSAPSYYPPGLYPEKIYSAELKLVQPLYLGGRIWKGIKLKRVARDISSLKKQETERQSLLRALKVAVDYSLISEQIKAIRQSLETQQDFVQLTNRKLKRGNAKKFEYFQNQANLKAYEARLQDLLVAKQNLSKTMNEWLRINTDEEVLIALPSLPSARVTLSQATSNAMLHRPDLMISKKQLELADLQKSMDMGSHLPSLQFIAAYGYSSTDSATLFDKQSQKDSMTIALTVPLFSGLSSFKSRKAAVSNISANEKMLMQKQQDVRLEVANSYQTFKAAQAVYELSSKWRDLAEKALDSGMKSFKTGVIPNVQLVQLQQSREKAVLSFLSSRANYYKTHLEFASSVGANLQEL